MRGENKRPFHFPDWPPALKMSFFMRRDQIHFMSQVPIDSGFGPANTTADVIKGIDLTGKIAIVTGGYVGLGLETTKTLLSAGATVIVPVRTPEKASVNLSGLNVEIGSLDLLDPSSIDAFASNFLSSGRPLHILINNAAIMASPLLRDSRGYEAQFSTNHLGHFQLTARLWPALVKANGARVVSVSSLGHHRSGIEEDWNFTNRDYEPWASYGQSKTANILFALELDSRGSKFGVRAFSLHPGVIIGTDLGRWTPEEERTKRWIQWGFVDAQGNPIENPLRGIKSIPQGASTQVWAATSPLLEGKGGLYLENNNIAPKYSEVEHDPQSGLDARGFSGVKDYAIDKVAAEKLWSLSQQLTGVTFDI
jgi:NAD(P)-dependent dehydrogenase (short-subunit alcohol dehydrogenase family)